MIHAELRPDTQNEAVLDLWLDDKANPWERKALIEFMDALKMPYRNIDATVYPTLVEGWRIPKPSLTKKGE